MYIFASVVTYYVHSDSEWSVHFTILYSSNIYTQMLSILENLTLILILCAPILMFNIRGDPGELSHFLHNLSYFPLIVFWAEDFLMIGS